MGLISRAWTNLAPPGAMSLTVGLTTGQNFGQNVVRWLSGHNA